MPKQFLFWCSLKMVATLEASSKPVITAKDEVIPYTTSITISTVALLAPLSFFALSVALSTFRQNEYETEDIRFLQQDACINATATDDSTLTTTWDAVKLTSIVATSVAVLCAIGYESFRRDPIVGKYVYDRKRLKDPDRTPPPLMLSRSLWTGCSNPANDNENNKSMTCWKVPPALLELIFVNLDHKYIRYSKAADDARKKREELGHYTCCRKGWYHNCCFCSKRKLNIERNDDVFVDDDGYEYFQGHDYTLEEEVIAKKFDTQWSKTVDDLFPRDSVSHYVGDIEEHCDADSESFNTAADLEHLSIQSDDEKRAGNPHSCIFKSSEDDSLKSVGSKKKIAYPYRLVYLFMPPGFHVWKDAIPYISHFFWFPAITRRFNLLFRRSKIDVRDNDISLTEPEKELLHFVGLDIYLLIRFARFGFDVSYYPFLVACIAVLPVYSSAAEGSSWKRYLSNSINNIQNGSNLIWVAVVFSVAFFLYVLRRLWVEWEVFIQLRHNFLANGAQHFHCNNVVKQKYRKTCIVESVPVEFRTDRLLYDTFNKLFPNQIERAEMLVDTSKLEALVNERKGLIVRLENLDSLDRYRRWENRGTKPNKVNASDESSISKLCCKKKQEKAMCEAKVLEVNGMIDAEYSALVDKRSIYCNASNVICERDSTRDPGLFSFNTIYRLFPSQLRTLIKSSNQFSSSCGIVEFKTFAAKQWGKKMYPYSLSFYYYLS